MAHSMQTDANENIDCVKRTAHSQYSGTSIARTPVARLSWLIRTKFFSPFEIFLITQNNKYLVKFSHFIMKLYVVCTH